MTVFHVRVDDNYHFMDEAERYELGAYASLEAAVAAAQALVDRELLAAFKPGLTAAQLYAQYTAFGPDPFIAPDDGQAVTFSAWAYARERCEALCGGRAE